MHQRLQNGTTIMPNAVALSVQSTTHSNTNTVTSLATVMPSLLYGESNTPLTLSNGHFPLASQLAGVAVLGKTPFLSNSASTQQQQQQQKVF